MSTETIIQIDSKGAYRTDITKTRIGDVSDLVREADGLDSIFQENPVMVVDMHCGPNGEIELRVLSKSEHLVLVKMSEFRLFGRWYPCGPSTLGFKPLQSSSVSADSLPTDSSQPYSFLATKSLPLNYWVAFALPGSSANAGTPWLRELDVDHFCRSGPNMYFLLNKYMNSHPADDFDTYPGSFMKPSALPNVHSNGRLCPGDTDIETTETWYEAARAKANKWLSNNTNADLNFDPTLWKCTPEMELTCSADDLLRDATTVGNVVTNLDLSFLNSM